MKAIFTSCFLLVVLSLFAQEHLVSSTKGLNPIAIKNNLTQKTYAVVVGISDYQDEGIPDLRFADKDAEAFAGFLQSPSGGSLDEDHLKVMLNEQATGAQFAIALDWLWEVVKEDDRVIIYFSGHGDVEKKSITQPGYLLCWDAPARVYLAGGAMNVRDLNDVISTLSIQNKAKVILVTDACRAGKLSGSSIGGSQATAANLSKQYNNEIKILSCQPNEYSIEGEQWGGGRGAFSYHLLDGLYGLADGNGDLDINLKEIARYLEDRVSEEVAPHAQNPMIVGSKTEKLINVLPEVLAQLTKGKRSELQLFTATESRGIEDEVLAQIAIGADTSIVEMYYAFKESLANRNFLEPKSACADFYYEILSNEPQLEKLHSSMRRNYAAALQDDAQQVLNVMLKSGLTEMILKDAKYADLYYNYPSYLKRAGELLGEQHYMYATLQARNQFFKGMILKTKSDRLSAFKKALSWQPEMAHAMVYMVECFEAEQLDSAMYYTRKAAEQVPSWVEPYIEMSNFYYITLRQPDKVEEMLQLAGEIDSSSVLVWYKKATFYKNQKKFDLAEKWFLKTISGTVQDICFPCSYINLGEVYLQTGRYEEAEIQMKKALQLDSTSIVPLTSLGRVYRETGRYDEAESIIKKAIQIDSTDIWPFISLAYTYEDAGRYKEAEKYYNKAIQIDSTDVDTYNDLGLMFMNQKRFKEAHKMFSKVITLNPKYVWGPYNMACLFSLQQNEKKAFDWLEKALEFKGIPYDKYTKDGDLDNIRDSERFKVLMMKYFPEEVKK